MDTFDVASSLRSRIAPAGIDAIDINAATNGIMVDGANLSNNSDTRPVLGEDAIALDIPFFKEGQ